MYRKEYMARWRAANPEKIKLYAHSHYSRNRKELLKRRTKWRKENPSYMSDYHRKHRNQ